MPNRHSTEAQPKTGKYTRSGHQPGKIYESVPRKANRHNHLLNCCLKLSLKLRELTIHCFLSQFQNRLGVLHKAEMSLWEITSIKISVQPREHAEKTWCQPHTSWVDRLSLHTPWSEHWPGQVGCERRKELDLHQSNCDAPQYFWCIVQVVGCQSKICGVVSRILM
jgi:hypothetical protein